MTTDMYTSKGMVRDGTCDKCVKNTKLIQWFSVKLNGIFKLTVPKFGQQNFLQAIAAIIPRG